MQRMLQVCMLVFCVNKHGFHSGQGSVVCDDGITDLIYSMSRLWDYTWKVGDIASIRRSQVQFADPTWVLEWNLRLHFFRLPGRCK